MIALCRHCRTLVNYKTSSDLLDGHMCPERVAAAKRAERTASRGRGPGGPSLDEAFSEMDLERDSLDDSEPPAHPEEAELAAVDYRLRFCRLCGSEQFRPQWDKTDPLVCSSCGAIYPVPGKVAS